VIFTQERREPLGKVVNEVQQTAVAVAIKVLRRLCGTYFIGLMTRHRVWQVTVNATRAKIRRMHASAADCLIHIHQIFALAKCKQHHGHSSAVNCGGSNPQQMVQHSRNLGEHDPNVLSALRNLQPQHFFQCKTVGMLVAHHRHVINMWIRPLNDLAIQFEHQTQYAVRCRVLRPEV